MRIIDNLCITATQCQENCYEGPTYTAGDSVSIGDDDDEVVNLTWRTSGSEGWYYELNELPNWASKIVAVRKPNDSRLKLFISEGHSLPNPIVIGNVNVHGTGLRENSERRMWQLDVNPSTLDGLNVPNINGD